jgi:hypothetical protein
MARLLDCEMAGKYNLAGALWGAYLNADAEGPWITSREILTFSKLAPAIGEEQTARNIWPDEKAARVLDHLRIGVRDES